jgi:predicted PurR-regulated permease PerM
MYPLPLTVRRSIELLGLFILGAIIVAGNIVIMPLLMAFFFSIMLLPVFRFFRKLEVPEVIAIFLPILLFIIFAALIRGQSENLGGNEISVIC